MKNYTLTAMLLLVCGTMAHCSTSDWEWFLGAYVGTASGASDSLDPTDVAISSATSPGPGHTAVYEQSGTNGWEDSNGLYKDDYKAPLDMTPGTSKTWRIYVWNDMNAPFGAPMGITWSAAWGAWDVLDSIDFRLTYVRSAIGVTDNMNVVGSSWLLNDWADGRGIGLPSYRTNNPLNGYIFDFTATVVPEPSSLAALGLAASGMCLGLLRRRRGR
jgi:hypothetical protein